MKMLKFLALFTAGVMLYFMGYEQGIDGLRPRGYRGKA